MSEVLAFIILMGIGGAIIAALALFGDWWYDE